jgi:hypothetical protein
MPHLQRCRNSLLYSPLLPTGKGAQPNTTPTSIAKPPRHTAPQLLFNPLPHRESTEVSYRTPALQRSIHLQNRCTAPTAPPPPVLNRTNQCPSLAPAFHATLLNLPLPGNSPRLPGLPYKVQANYALLSSPVPLSYNTTGLPTLSALTKSQTLLCTSLHPAATVVADKTKGGATNHCPDIYSKASPLQPFPSVAAAHTTEHPTRLTTQESAASTRLSLADTAFL